MNIVWKTNDEIQAAKGRINAEKLDSVTEEEIESWIAEDGIDDAALGPARYAQGGADVRAVRE